MSSDNLPVLSQNTVQRYIHGALKIPALSEEEEYELFRKYQEENDSEAAKEIVKSNLKLVVNSAYRYRKFRDIADLIQEGNMGLLTALKKYDRNKGVRFATYASWWIKAKIQEFIISHLSIVRFGKTRDERKLFFNLMTTINDIERYKAGRKLSSEEIIQQVATRLNVSPEKIREAISTLRGHSEISTSSTYSDNSGSEVKRIELEDDKVDFEDDIDAKEQKKAVKDSLSFLTERERNIIEKRYLTDKPLTLRELGKFYGITKERIRQIENKALKKMREHTPRLLSYS
ncbi:MAG: sigma-70 family RNA polymerase sigma factor [bacterium]